MMDYTKAAFNQVLTDLKKAAHGFSVTMNVAYIAYLLYALITGMGNPIVNGGLLGLTCAYFLFFLCVTSFGKTPDGKALSDGVKAFYKWCKRLIKLYTLGVAVYGIYTATAHVELFSVLLTACMILFWVLDIAFELLVKYATARINLIVEGIKTDVDNVVKPFRTTGNFFKKLVGKEVEPEKEPTKQRLFLDQLVAENKEQRAAEKEQKKQEEKLFRLQKREEKKLEKLQRKGGVADPEAEFAFTQTPDIDEEESVGAETPAPTKKQLRALTKQEKKAAKALAKGRDE